MKGTAEKVKQTSRQAFVKLMDSKIFPIKTNYQNRSILKDFAWTHTYAYLRIHTHMYIQIDR